MREITGALIADRLTREGMDVVVLDRRDVATGSTAATTALLEYDLDVPISELARRFGVAHAAAIYRAAARALEDLCMVIQGLPERCGFSRRPTLKLASRRQDLSGLRRDLDLLCSNDLPAAVLNAAELESVYGLVAPGALRLPAGAQVDPYRLAHALLHRARAGGARIYDRTTLVDLLPADGWRRGMELRTDDGVSLQAEALVLAIGYEALEGLPCLAQLRATYAFVTEPIEVPLPWKEPALVWETADPYFYLRQTDDGRILCGGEDDSFSTLSRRDKRLPLKVSRLLKRLGKTWPGVAVEVAYCWAGTFGETDDGLPFIGQLGRWRNTWLAACLGGNGITFGAMAANIVAEGLQGRAHPDTDIVSPARLTRARLPNSE